MDKSKFNNVAPGKIITETNGLLAPGEVEKNISAFTHALLTTLERHTCTPDLREGLKETPARVAKAWAYWTKGYAEDPAEILKTFEDGGEGYREMVLVKDIPLFSKCEHHLADIFGTASVAYIPNGRIVGLSKLSRLVDCFARRLQVQERLTTQICEALQHHLAPLGAAVYIKARHACMETRGICQQGHHTVTSHFTGNMRSYGHLRNEFLDQVK